MNDTNITKNTSERNLRSARPARLAVIGGAIALSAALLGAAAIPAEAAPAAARPSVTLTFNSATVATGTQPVITFIGEGLPFGSVLYLQRGSAAGTGWQNVARSAVSSGSAKIPADEPGRYEYRMVAVDDRIAIASSADVPLTVTAKPGGCGGVCAVGHAALPWLKMIGQSILSFAVGKVLAWIWSIFF